ncbi:MAG: hypothetical protein D6688_10030, partial [Alphaproteobacteria bacterium]
MAFPSLEAFIKDGAPTLGKGPYAMIFAEDLVEVDSSVWHALSRGFRHVIVFGPDELALDPGLPASVKLVRHDVIAPDGVTRAVNAMIEARPGEWMHYCYNAEYLFYPFCETRTVGEMLAFHAEERRDAMLCYVIDLYAGPESGADDGVDLETAHLDRTGYYALGRSDPLTGEPKERQLDFFGGLRWRFEEHIPPAKRKIDRIALFRARPGVRLRENHTFTDEEYNTYSCPWHHNLTAAIASFRTAKALR